MSGVKNFSPARQVVWISRFLLWMAMVFLFCPGCNDSIDLCEPPVPVGRVEGWIRSGGLTLDANVTATNNDGVYPNRAEFQTEPNDAGFFSFDLPSGRYTFQLKVPGGRYDYIASGTGFGQVPPDTVEVGAGIFTPEINFDLGGVTLGFDLPAYMHGQYGQVVLHPPDLEEWGDWRRVTVGIAEIVTGRLELEVAGVLPGEYQVEVTLGCLSSSCWPTSGGERFWMPGTHDQSESPWYTVGPDSVLSFTGAMLGEPARLEGRVSGAWLDMGIQQRPVVSIVTEDSLLTLSRIGTDDDGRFDAAILMPRPVKLLVSQFGIDYWIGGPGFEDATVFDLESGVTITGIEHEQCGIHLVVDETEALLRGSRILVYNKADLSLVTTNTDWGGSNRHIAIPNLWPGEFLIHIDHKSWERGTRDWKSQWFDRAATVDQAQPVLLAAAGQLARLNLVVELGGQITGRLLDEEGPLKSYMVWVYPVGEENSWAEIFEFDYSFNMKGLPDGDYVLGAQVFSFDPQEENIIWYPGTLDRQEAQIIEIRDASVVEGADIIIPQ